MNEIYNKVDEYLEKGSFNSAIDFLNEELTKDSENSLLYSELGRVYMALNDLEEAKKSFDKAISIDSTSSQNYYYKAIISSMEEKPDETLSYIDKVLEMDGESDDLLNIKGLALFSKGKYSDASSSFKKATKLNSKEPMYEYNLGKSFAMRGEFKNAIQAFDRAISIDGSYADFYFEKAKCFAALEDYFEASNLVYRALEFDGENTLYKLSYLRFTGLDYLNQNNPHDAIPFLEKLVEAHTNIDNSIILTRAYVSARDEESAMAMYNMILEKDKDNAELHLENAEYLSEINKFDEAIDAYSKFVEVVNRKKIKKYEEVASEIEKNLSLVNSN